MHKRFVDLLETRRMLVSTYTGSSAAETVQVYSDYNYNIVNGSVQGFFVNHFLSSSTQGTSVIDGDGVNVSLAGGDDNFQGYITQPVETTIHRRDDDPSRAVRGPDHGDRRWRGGHDQRRPGKRFVEWRR